MTNLPNSEEVKRRQAYAEWYAKKEEEVRKKTRSRVPRSEQGAKNEETTNLSQASCVRPKSQRQQEVLLRRLRRFLCSQT